jgi:quercetin dioxygenase-like cupin family protein
MLLLAICGAILFTVGASALTLEHLAFGTIPFLDRFNGPADVYVDRITLDPGDTTTWHYHPGDAYGVVKAGAVILIDGCGTATEYSAGEAFLEPAGEVHEVNNEGDVPAEFLGTLVVPAGAPPVTFVAGPLCGPPRSTEQCKGGAWQQFNNPPFHNQGECVAYVQRATAAQKSR